MFKNETTVTVYNKINRTHRFSLTVGTLGDIGILAPELVLDHRLDQQAALVHERVLQQRDEQLGELLGVLLHTRVESQFADEVGRVDELPSSVLHHCKQGLQACHLTPWLIGNLVFMISICVNIIFELILSGTSRIVSLSFSIGSSDGSQAYVAFKDRYV